MVPGEFAIPIPLNERPDLGLTWASQPGGISKYRPVGIIVEIFGNKTISGPV